MTAQPMPLVQAFQNLRDPRIELKSIHNLHTIVLIVVIATVAGADDFVAMAKFARAKSDWLRDRMGLQFPNGVPSHDTLNRVMALLDPEEFQACFQDWVASLVGPLQGVQIPIDGKTLRRSKHKTGDGYRAIQIVSAWAAKAGVSLGQVRTDEKSNEITAIPQLLDLLDIAGALVSIDAMGCQKEIAAQIISKKADYLLAVKDNQPHLAEDVAASIQKAIDEESPKLESCIQVEPKPDHGRLETRECWVLTDLEGIRDQELWKGLKVVGCVQSTRVINGQTSIESRYYIGSKAMTAAELLAGSRTHWTIENPCHWVLDVAFREDDSRLREGHGPENLAWVRKLALTLLKRTNEKCGIKNRRLLAGWDMDYLERVFSDFLDK